MLAARVAYCLASQSGCGVSTNIEGPWKDRIGCWTSWASLTFALLLSKPRFAATFLQGKLDSDKSAYHSLTPVSGLRVEMAVSNIYFFSPRKG
jgi:hypothetical protein